MLYYILIFNEREHAAKCEKPEYKLVYDEWLHTFWTNGYANGKVRGNVVYAPGETPMPATLKQAKKALAEARSTWPGVSYMIARADLNPVESVRP